MPAFRCYNGCPDSAMQAHLDAITESRRRLTEVIPGARCTYFPMEGQYQCFTSDHKMIGRMDADIHHAIQSAIDNHQWAASLR